MQVPSLGQEDPLEKEMATHSSILAWKIPWIEEPGGLQFMGSPRARHEHTAHKPGSLFLLFFSWFQLTQNTHHHKKVKLII